MPCRRSLCLQVILLALLFASAKAACADPVSIIHKQGPTHAFLVVKSEAGKVIGVGDLLTEVHGDRARTRLTFRFRDGSLDDDVTDFTEAGTLRLVRDHHIQHGPSFPTPLDMDLNAVSGIVTTHETKNGKLETKSEHMDLPPDLVNGIWAVAIQNLPPSAQETRFSYLAPGFGKLRLLKVVMTPSVPERYRVAGVAGKALRYRVHLELGGLAGVIAPMIGKAPADLFVTVLGGAVPMAVKLEGPLYLGGPTWTAAMASPVWSGTPK